jgi:phage terminase Nu1 subunit (DNA packaging protein)
MDRSISISELTSIEVSSRVLGFLLGGVDKKTIERYAADDLAVRVGHGRYLLGESLHRVTKRLREQAAGRLGRDENVDAARANAELKDAQRRLTEIKIKQLEGELISLPEVRAAWSEVALNVKQMFLSLPARARFLLSHLSGHDQKVLDQLVRDLLDEVALMDDEPRLP